MNKAKIEMRAEIPVIVFPCGGCRPCGHAEYEIIKELEHRIAKMSFLLKEIGDNVINEWPYEFSYYREKIKEELNEI